MEKMDDLLCWCLPGVPQAVIDPSNTKPTAENYKAKARDLMVVQLGGKGPSADKMGDLDELIKNRNEDDLSFDEIIKNDKALDTVIAGVRLLIKKNDRLIVHCEKYRWESEGGFTFNRIEINHVKVDSSEESSNLSRIALKTTPRRKTKDFGLPADIPAALADIIVIKTGNGGLPDYGRFLERALLLNNDVLKPFLHILQKHLEGIAAFYNEVAAWIAEPDADRAFLEKTFQVAFDLGSPTAITTTSKEPEDDGTQCTSGDDSSEDGAGNAKGADLDIRHAVVDQEILLREYTAEGNYTLSFFIEYGKTDKLLRFIEYLQQ